RPRPVASRSSLSHRQVMRGLGRAQLQTRTASDAYSLAVRALLWVDESVTDVPHRTDQLLVLCTELRAQPPHVYVHRARTAEVVVAPDLLKQLRPREHPAGVLRQVLQQLELLEGQVQHPVAQPRGVRGLVDCQVAVSDLQRQVLGA